MKWVVFGLWMLACATPSPPTTRISQGHRVTAPAASPIAYRHYLSARLALERGQPDVAVAHLREALLSDPRSAFLHARLAEILFQLGNLEEAKTQAQLALELDPDLEEAQKLLANLHSQ